MTGLRVRLGYCVASSSAPMCSSPGLTSEAMESVAISTSARGVVLSWKDWEEEESKEYIVVFYLHKKT